MSWEIQSSIDIITEYMICNMYIAKLFEEGNFFSNWVPSFFSVKAIVQQIVMLGFKNVVELKYMCYHLASPFNSYQAQY